MTRIVMSKSPSLRAFAGNSVPSVDGTKESRQPFLPLLRNDWLGSPIYSHLSDVTVIALDPTPYSSHEWRSSSASGRESPLIFGGIGGGVSRDVLLNDVPGPLKGPVYERRLQESDAAVEFVGPEV